MILAWDKQKGTFLTHFVNFGHEGAPNVTKLTYNILILWENSPRKKNWGSFVHWGLRYDFLRKKILTVPLILQFNLYRNMWVLIQKYVRIDTVICCTAVRQLLYFWWCIMTYGLTNTGHQQIGTDKKPWNNVYMILSFLVVTMTQEWLSSLTKWSRHRCHWMGNIIFPDWIWIFPQNEYSHNLSHTELVFKQKN